MTLHVHFGHAVARFLDAERARVGTPSKRYPGCFESDSLCRWQTDMHRQGFRQARLCQTGYGWSVRSGSGLDDFCVLAGHRDGTLPNATLQQALDWEIQWAKKDPTHRYVTD